MKQIIPQRPPQYHSLNPPHYPYQINPQNTITKAPRGYPSQHFTQSVPTQVQPSIQPGVSYTQGQQLGNYLPQYQPIYVTAPPTGGKIAPGYPSYIIQPMPGYNHHPQVDFNLNFDYETANFLCDTKIVQNSVFCVICGTNFKGSQKQEHLKKHMRRPNQTSAIFVDLPNKTNYESKASSNKKQYITKPIVQPEQHTIQYEPLVYDLVHQINYVDNSYIQMQDQSINCDPNVSLMDQNISIDRGNNLNIPNQIKPQTNPFSSKASPSQLKTGPNQPAYNSNTLNQPVPFLPNIQLDTITHPNGANQSMSKYSSKSAAQQSSFRIQNQKSFGPYKI